MSARLQRSPLTPRPPTPVRLLHTPRPFPDETFGSWFRRLAAFQHASREELAGALLGSPELLGPQPVDWDVHPPPELIEQLSRCSMVDRASLEALILSPSGDLLRPHERNMYCPRCWEEDFQSLTVHERGSWLNCWTLRCVKHDHVLRSFKASPEPAMRHSASLAATGAYPLPKTAQEDSDSCSSQIVLMPFMRREYVRPLEKQCIWRACDPDPFARRGCAKGCGPQHISEWIAGRRWDMQQYWPESSKMGSAVRDILRDLVLFVGSAVSPDEPTLLESWQAEGAWLDDGGNRCEWPHVQPRGPLAIRLSAVSLAFALLCMMHDVRFARFAGARDNGYGLANLLLWAHRPAMLTGLHRMLGKWPAIYFQRWFEAYREALAWCRYLRAVGL